MRFVLFSVSIILGSISASSQENTLGSTLIENIENSAEADDLNDGDELLIADLEFLIEHPVDLNKSSYEELIATGLFQPVQANNIIVHIQKSGWLYEKEELQVIEGFENDFIRSIQSYITLSDPQSVSRIPFKSLLMDADKYLLLRSSRTLEPSIGFMSASNYRYPGIQNALYGKFLMRYGNQLSVGFTLENDPGEKLMSQSRVVDFFSWHAFLRGGKRLKTLAIGDYAIRYGQGLTISTGQRAGLPGSPISFKKFNPGILPYRSVNESDFLRGAAATINFKKIDIDVFYSSRKLDATIYEDTLLSYFNTISSSGLHRSESEVANRQSLNAMNSGIHMRFADNGFEVGLTYHVVAFDIPMRNSGTLYSVHDQSGNSFQKIGIDYSFVKANFQYYGEIALSNYTDLALVTGVTVQLDHHLTWSVLYRNYSSSFNKLYSSPISSSSDFTGEQGFTVGAIYRISRFFEIDVLVDHYKMRWLTFSSDQPKVGSALICTFRWKPERHSELYIRFRRKIKTESSAPVINGLKVHHSVIKQNIRVHYGITLNKTITFRSRVEGVFGLVGSVKRTGYLIYQDILYKPMMKPLSVGVRYALFNTDSYDERIYTYENDVLYAFSIPSYYYRGARFYLLLRYKISSSLDFWLKYGITKYSDREIIGSGYDQINDNKKSQLKAQVRIRF